MRFPILAKILLLFALNVVLLGVAFYLLFRAQFAASATDLFTTLAGPRVQMLAEDVADELRQVEVRGWERVLGRFSESTGLGLAVLDRPGWATIGAIETIPDDLKGKVEGQLMRGGERGERRGPPPRRDAFSDWLEGGFGPGGEHRPPPLWNPDGPYPMVAHRGGEPPGYWVVVRIPTVEVPGGYEPRLLVIRSRSMLGSGWFLDPKPWLMVGFGALLLSVGLWTPLALSLTGALRRIQGTTARIAEGNFEARVPDAGRGDEMGALGLSVNQMAQRLEELVGGQRRFMADVAHELCSPIARMQAALGILEQQVEAGSRQQKSVTRLGGQLAEISGLVNELLSFSRSELGGPGVQTTVVALRPLLEEEVVREGGGGDVRLEVEGDPQVRAEPRLLGRAVGNLIRNAVRYAGEAGPVWVRVESVGSGRTQVRVTDCGPGVPEEAIPRLLDAFYRPDESRNRQTGGVGLGLAIVKSSVAACGGTVGVRNRESGGLEVTLELERVSG